MKVSRLNLACQVEDISEDLLAIVRHASTAIDSERNKLKDFSSTSIETEVLQKVEAIARQLGKIQERLINPDDYLQGLSYKRVEPD